MSIRDWYRAIRSFLRNLRMFLKLAWHWRPWDYFFTTQALIAMLKAHGDYLRHDGFLTNGEKVYKRCYAAAGYLERAYIDEYEDKAVTYWLGVLISKYGYFGHNAVERDKLGKDNCDAIYRLALKREASIQEDNRKFAWEYLSKHFGSFWS